MQFQVIQPHGMLRQFVKYYWIMESDTNEGNVTERVIPTETIQIMFHYKHPFKVYIPEHPVLTQSQSFISGLTDAYCDVSTHGEAGVIAVCFYPSGACHFFDFPLQKIENQSINLNDIFHSEIRFIEEKLYNLHTVKERIECVEEFLLQHFALIPKYDYQLLESGIRLIKTQISCINAHTLSNTLNITPKSLERKFSKYIGKTPKQFIKLIRFQEIMSNIYHSKNLSLEVFAHENGFYDQAHFNKDFKFYTGFTPKEYVVKYVNNSNETSCHFIDQFNL